VSFDVEIKRLALFSWMMQLTIRLLTEDNSFSHNQLCHVLYCI